jgi:hypothetical protein
VRTDLDTLVIALYVTIDTALKVGGGAPGQG